MAPMGIAFSNSGKTGRRGMSPNWLDRSVEVEYEGAGGPRPARRRARHPGPEPQGHGGGQTAASQAPEKTRLGAAGHDHRQAGELRRGETVDHARGRAQAVQGPEQPGGEQSPADPTTGADHELSLIHIS